MLAPRPRQMRSCMCRNVKDRFNPAGGCCTSTPGVSHEPQAARPDPRRHGGVAGRLCDRVSVPVPRGRCRGDWRLLLRPSRSRIPWLRLSLRQLVWRLGPGLRLRLSLLGIWVSVLRLPVLPPRAPPSPRRPRRLRRRHTGSAGDATAVAAGGRRSPTARAVATGPHPDATDGACAVDARTPAVDPHAAASDGDSAALAPVRSRPTQRPVAELRRQAEPPGADPDRPGSRRQSQIQSLILLALAYARPQANRGD